MPSTLLPTHGTASSSAGVQPARTLRRSAPEHAVGRPRRPPGALAVGLVASATWRGRRYRVARSAAWRLGEALGARVLVGRTAKGSPIALLMIDHQHRHLFFLRQHEPDVSALFARLVRPHDTVFDVGANAGYFSLLARDLGARAFAFEPNPVALRLIRRTLELRGGGVTLVPAACTDREGSVTLYHHSLRNTGMASLERSEGRPVTVRALRLDTFAAARGLRPQLLKIDAEGHELAVISGARRLLRDVRPVAIVETASTATLAAMDALGYAPRRITPDGRLAGHPGVLEGDQYENVCFVPVERGGSALPIDDEAST